MKIGLLEDNPAVLDYMQTALTMAGHEVHAHTQSISLLETLRAAFSAQMPPPYDVAIIDILLPGPDSGTNTITQLRHWLSPQQLPIIVVSACSPQELDNIQVSFPDVITLRKPFKIKTLLQHVARVQAN